MLPTPPRLTEAAHRHYAGRALASLRGGVYRIGTGYRLAHRRGQMYCLHSLGKNIEAARPSLRSSRATTWTHLLTTQSAHGDAYRDGLPIRISVHGRTTLPPLRPNKCTACMFGRATAHYSRPQLPPASMVYLATDRATVCAVLVRRSCFPASPSRYACPHSNGRIIRTVHPKGSRVIL